jgi:hypothetical protein
MELQINIKVNKKCLSILELFHIKSTRVKKIALKIIVFSYFFYFSFIKYLSNAIFSLRMLLPGYEIPIELRNITDNRIKIFITSKQKD